jgi:hypothetical protein
MPSGKLSHIAIDVILFKTSPGAPPGLQFLTHGGSGIAIAFAPLSEVDDSDEVPLVGRNVATPNMEASVAATGLVDRPCRTVVS